MKLSAMREPIALNGGVFSALAVGMLNYSGFRTEAVFAPAKSAVQPSPDKAPQTAPPIVETAMETGTSEWKKALVSPLLISPVE
jgi:hypothetical protein